MTQISGMASRTRVMRKMTRRFMQPVNGNDLHELPRPPIGDAFAEAERDNDYASANTYFVLDAWYIAEEIRDRILEMPGFQPDLCVERVSHSLADACTRLHSSQPSEWREFAPRYWNLAHEFTYYITRIELLIQK